MPGSLVPNWLCERFTTQRADINRMNYINYLQRYLENDDDDWAEKRRDSTFMRRSVGSAQIPALQLQHQRKMPPRELLFLREEENGAVTVAEFPHVSVCVA